MHNFLLYKFVSVTFFNISNREGATAPESVSKKGRFCLQVHIAKCWATQCLEIAMPIDLLNAANCNFLLFLVTEIQHCMHVSLVLSKATLRNMQVTLPTQRTTCLYIHIKGSQWTLQESHACVLTSISKGERSVNQFYFIQAAMHVSSYSFEG